MLSKRAVIVIADSAGYTYTACIKRTGCSRCRYINFVVCLIDEFSGKTAANNSHVHNNAYTSIYTC